MPEPMLLGNEIHVEEGIFHMNTYSQFIHPYIPLPPTYNAPLDASRARAYTPDLPERIPPFPRAFHAAATASHLASPLVPMTPPAERKLPRANSEEVDESNARANAEAIQFGEHIPLLSEPDNPPVMPLQVDEAMSHLATPLVPLTPPAEVKEPPTYTDPVDASKANAYTVIESSNDDDDTPPPSALHTVDRCSSR